MKPTTLLLTASLVANVALLAYVATRPANPPAATASGTPSKSAPTAGTDNAAALRAALASGDAAALEAAGLSPELARELAIGRIFAQLGERVRAAQSSQSKDDRWWRIRRGPGSREQQLLVRREFADALTAAFGDDLGLLGGDSSQYAFLPPEKRDALRRIMQDYDEMMAKFSAGGIQLASDKEKLALLRAERDRDIAALLTPEERLAYEMRTSSSAMQVRARYGDAIETEEEFRRLYELQKAFDEKFPRDALTGRISPETLRARSEAQRQLENEIRAAVGEERYAELQRASDPDVRTVASLVERLNLPATTTDTVLAARDAFAAESQRINSDSSLSVPERRAKVQELAARAKAELTAALGAEAADAYAQRSSWMNMLQSGMAYSTTTPADSPGSMFGGPRSVYPVVPAGIMPANAERHLVINAAPPVDPVAGGIIAAMPADVTAPIGVMSYSSTFVAAEPPAAGGPAVPVRRNVILAPAPDPATAPATPPTTTLQPKK